MKSNKQRRAEIKQRRLDRAARLAARLRAGDGLRLRLAGMEPADREALSRCNNTYALLPEWYLDRAFTCRDCGADEVWTAKQQKWWYEVAHGPIDSTAVRCLACRRARRAKIVATQAVPGASRLALETEQLRALGQSAPTEEALAQVQDALNSKWWSLRTVAIEVLGYWHGPAQIAQLEALAASRSASWNTWERVAADAARKALERAA